MDLSRSRTVGQNRKRMIFVRKQEDNANCRQILTVLKGCHSSCARSVQDGRQRLHRNMKHTFPDLPIAKNGRSDGQRLADNVKHDDDVPRVGNKYKTR